MPGKGAFGTYIERNKKVSDAYRISKYWIFTLMMLIALCSKSQVIYTDIIPNKTIYKCSGYGESTVAYEIDLNNDGINDFRFQINHKK